MKSNPVTVTFDPEKLDALRLYMTRKGMDLERELDDVLEKLYQKTVPAGIREYIEARQTVQETPGRKRRDDGSYPAQTENWKSEVSGETVGFHV